MPLRGVIPASGFNAYAAGNKNYGMGRGAPNIGPVDKLGYRVRDRQAAVKRRLDNLRGRQV